MPDTLIWISIIIIVALVAAWFGRALSSRPGDNVTQRLADHERALGEKIDNSLNRLGDSFLRRLGDTASTQQKGLSQINERLAIIDHASKDLHDLSQHVTSLTQILGNARSRGAFGEHLLENLIRDALPTSTYDLQKTLPNNTRVDCLLKVPSPGLDIAIDAKFPRQPYENFINASADQRPSCRKAFSANLKDHIRTIAKKYIISGVTAENAIMFVPSESIYMTIEEEAQDALSLAHSERVAIVSPSTLWSLIYFMRALLRDTRMRQQANIIQKETLVLVSDVTRLADRVDKLETHFSQAQKDIHAIRISGDKITKRSNKIIAIDCAADDEAETPKDKLGKQD